MKKNNKILNSFENTYQKRSSLGYKEKLRIYESLWKEACNLKIFPLKDPLEGIEADIRIAKILNSCSKKH